MVVEIITKEPGLWYTQKAISVDPKTVEKYVYVFDGKAHKSNVKKGQKYPPIMVDMTVPIFGTLEDALSVGYHPCILTEKEYVSRSYVEDFYKKYGALAAVIRKD